MGFKECWGICWIIASIWVIDGVRLAEAALGIV